MRGFIIQDGMVKLVEGSDLFHARMKRLFFTPINSMIGYLGKGSRVLSYFWEGATTATARNILTEVKLLVSAYELGTSLKGIGVRLSPIEKSNVPQLEIELEAEVDGIKEKTVVGR